MEKQVTSNEGNCVKSEASVESNQSEPQKDDKGDRLYNVYVKSFSASTDTEKLQQIFSEFGTILSCTVLCDHSGKSKQVGFVQFSSDEEATRAVTEMHGKEGYGPKPLHVAMTNPKPARMPKKTYPLSSSLTPLPGALPPAPFPLAYHPGQPGIYHPQVWPGPPGTVPFVIFPAPYPSPLPFAQQPPPGVAFGQPVRQPGNQPPHPALYHAAPYIVPYAAAPPQMLPGRNMRAAHPGGYPNFVTNFYQAPAAYPGYAWSAPYPGQLQAVPIGSGKAHVIS